MGHVDVNKLVLVEINSLVHPNDATSLGFLQYNATMLPACDCDLFLTTTIPRTVSVVSVCRLLSMVINKTK